MKRRNFVKLSGGALIIGGGSYAIGRSVNKQKYEKRVAKIWKHHPNTEGQNLMENLVRYAILAANSHNTQPWFFKLEPNRISILPDFERRCPAVDPDDHHLYASLGCAAENIIVAAKAHGLHANLSIIENAEAVIQIDFESTAASDSDLFQAIPHRQCTRGEYDGNQVSNQQLSILETMIQDDGISTRIFTDEKDLEKILEYVVAGNTAQMNDEAFMKELKQWLRFNEASVMKHGDGLFAASSNNPTLPTWLGKSLIDFVFKTDTENDKYRNHIRSSAGVIAFISEKNNIKSWINAGRSYQRFALQSTSFGLKHAFINQAVEVPTVRTQLANFLNIGNRRTDLLIRFGYGPELPKSLRRPIEAVII